MALKNLKLERVVKIAPYFTVSDWNLLDETDPVGARVCAQRLNETLKDYVNRGEDRARVRFAVGAVMMDHKDVGAMDTEPQAFLDQILNEIFGE